MLGNDAAAADDGLYMAELMYSEQEKRSRVVHTLWSTDHQFNTQQNKKKHQNHAEKSRYLKNYIANKSRSFDTSRLETNFVDPNWVVLTLVGLIISMKLEL